MNGRFYRDTHAGLTLQLTLLKPEATVAELLAINRFSTCCLSRLFKME